MTAKCAARMCSRPGSRRESVLGITGRTSTSARAAAGAAKACARSAPASRSRRTRSQRSAAAAAPRPHDNPSSAPHAWPHASSTHGRCQCLACTPAWGRRQPALGKQRSAGGTPSSSACRRARSVCASSSAAAASSASYTREGINAAPDLMQTVTAFRTRWVGNHIQMGCMGNK